MTTIRWSAVVGCLSLAAVLAACGSGGGEPSHAAPAPTTGAAASPGGTAGATPTPTPSGTGGLVLAEGKQHEVCGIALTVKFVPPSQTGGAQDQAFLVAAQSGGGDVPSPSTVAPARAGTTVTVLGRRFTVNSVDLVNRRVSVEALC